TRFSRDWSSDVCSSDLIHPVLVQITITLGVLSRSKQINRIDFGDGHNRTFVNDHPVDVLAFRYETFSEVVLSIEPLRIPDLHQADAVQAGYSVLNGRALILYANDPLKLVGALHIVHSFTGNVGNQIGRLVLSYLNN